MLSPQFSPQTENDPVIDMRRGPVHFFRTFDTPPLSEYLASQAFALRGRQGSEDYSPRSRTFISRAMRFRGVCVLLCLLFLADHSFQETPSKKKGGKKDGGNAAAIEELKKQVEDILLDVQLLKEQQALQAVCLKGTKIHGKCFLADSARKNYHTANEDCIARGGTLSTPLTGDENDQLFEYVQRTMGPEVQVWIGVNDMVFEGNWVDMTGSSVRYKNWETEITRQPDGGRTHNCAVLSTTANGKWFDENCKAEKAFVCEFNIV